MSETLTQHVVLSDVEYDDLVRRLALAEAVVAVARDAVVTVEDVEDYDALRESLLAYDRSAAQERDVTSLRHGV